MAPRRKGKSERAVGDYRHDEARRPNNPPAGIAPTYEVRERRTTSYQYDPHLDPQLQWAGKAEHTSFEVDVVSLHIHERIATRAILDAVRRPQPLQLSLFGETPLPADQQIEFYQHEVGWANRLILGDSLLVMNSLLVKEGMAGKVQMIYVDPPYGIKYSSNFQPRIDRRDVKDKDEDLTHEPEQIKAYRDTWKLGIHSYLTYLRDRLLLARELLTESGSIFVQINDENLHLVRSLLDEVFGRENFVAVVAFRKTGAKTARGLDMICDYLLWYSRDKTQMKYRQLFLPSSPIEGKGEQYTHVEMPDGSRHRLTGSETVSLDDSRVFQAVAMTSQGWTESGSFSFRFNGRDFIPPPNRHWSTSSEGLNRLAHGDRIVVAGDTVRYVRYLNDYPVTPLTNIWDDTMGERDMLYAVQTNTKVIERCILMTTDPGDLVFDPTCVRAGTRVWVVGGPPQSPRTRGEEDPLPVYGEGRGGAALVPIETIQVGDWVLAHDGTPHRVLRVIRRKFKGQMVGIRHSLSDTTLWLTADHEVLAKLRPRTLGGQSDWSAIPKALRGRSKELRREMTPPERKLWARLRNRQIGFTFRRQHPIGPYIADFYSREARLVVEVDGAEFHGTEAAIAHDAVRDAYLKSLGLHVLHIPAREVERDSDQVCEAIHLTCENQMNWEDAQWIETGNLVVGDVVFFGPERLGARIIEIRSELTEEEVYDIEVEGAHSFITEVCVVHNCGSGTTAYCAEKWGRRWITCDTSRVALAIARQRLMTSRFDYYELRDPERGPAGGFFYETVPHITLESIAKNPEIDAIAAKYQPEIDQALADLNRALVGARHASPWKEWEVPREVPHPVWPKEAQEAYSKLFELKRSGKLGAETEATPLLETVYRLTGHRWEGLDEVPDPMPPDDWPEEAKEALRRFWEAKRAKRQEIDASIQRNAPQETLYDRPQVKRGVVRVSGPFTVEAIPVPAIEDPTQAPILPFEEEETRARISDRGGDYLTTMVNLLQQQGGVLFPGGKKMELQNLRLQNLGQLHAEAEIERNGKTLRVAISFGPQYGPVTAFQVQEAIPTARMNAYHVLIFAGFSFDPEAQALIQKAPVKGLEVHFANIAPDVLVGDLLKTTRASQIFTVFGQPDVRISPAPSTGRAVEGATYVVELAGVDIYDPVTGETEHARGSDVAAWFLDTDYDGMTFHICQAFFPGDADAWDKLQRALRAQIDPEAFEQMRGTVSFPFQEGEHKRIAVKVIDFRGNEVMRVMRLGGEGYE